MEIVIDYLEDEDEILMMKEFICSDFVEFLDDMER